MSARACNIAMGRTIATREHAPLSGGSTPSPDDAPLSEDTTPSESAPLSDSGRGTTQAHLWTQKFGKKEITTEKQLYNTIEYIRNNRPKHELSEYTRGACSLVGISEKISCTPDHAFRSEYKGGFDIVIGNPPYVSKTFTNDVKAFLKNNYETSEYQLDMYVAFMEKAVKISRKLGKVGYIVPNSNDKNRGRGLKWIY